LRAPRLHLPPGATAEEYDEACELALKAAKQGAGERALKAAKQGAGSPGGAVSSAPGRRGGSASAACLAAQCVPTAGGRTEAATAHGALLVRSHKEALSAKLASGGVVSSADTQTTAILEAASRLVPLLPLQAQARALGVTLARLLAMPAEDVTEYFATVILKHWSPSTAAEVCGTWTRFVLWTDREGIPFGGSFSGVDVADFLAEVHADAVARATGRRDGSSAGPAAKRNLEFVQRNLGVDLSMESTIVRVTAAKTSVGRAVPVPALTILIVAALERATGHASPFVRGVCAVLVAMALGCVRFAQAQRARLQEGGPRCGCMWAETLLDKHPDPAKQRPRPFWIPARGLVSGEWHLALREALAGVEAGCFFWRDSNSPSGDPYLATAWRNGPCSAARALVGLRSVLVGECGVPPHVAATFGLHSARHFLPEVALARNLPPEDRVEIGRWSGSTAQDVDLIPDVRAAAASARRAGEMPDRYAPKAKVVRVCRILTEQVAAARAVATQYPPPDLLGGWDLLAWQGGG